jgi:hypothetical protein
MAHYAFINSENIVVKVISGVDENVTQDNNGTLVGGSAEAWEQFYESQPWHEGLVCKQTSYNTRYVYEYEYDNSVPPKIISATIVGSEHSNGGTPFRGTYAGIGYTYDAATDTFVPPVVEPD